jgi:hypothetical protein
MTMFTDRRVINWRVFFGNAFLVSNFRQQTILALVLNTYVLHKRQYTKVPGVRVKLNFAAEYHKSIE